MGQEDFQWLDTQQFLRIDQVREDLRAVWTCGATSDLLQNLQTMLQSEFKNLHDCDSAVSNLSRFILASRSPISLLSLFERDEDALPSLLKFFASSQTLANMMIADPESFDLVRESDGQPSHRKYMVDEATALLSKIDTPERAVATIRKFVDREMLRIAYGEFVRELSPDGVGHQLAHVADGIIEAALQFALGRVAKQFDQPILASGQIPKFSIIGLGNLGGEELAYGAPLSLMFLYDTIDEKNPSHLEFYATLVREILQLISPSDEPDGSPLSFKIDISLSRGIHKANTDHLVGSVKTVARTLESKGLTWQRMAFVKARVVAGDQELGESFIKRIRPWVYRRAMSRADLVDIRTLRGKLKRRTEAQCDRAQNVLTDTGGRQDIELTIQFLQLLHGSELPDVRTANCAAAIDVFRRTGCLTNQESNLLATNYARLCRLQHHLSVLFGLHTGKIPADNAMLKAVAWHLGIKDEAGDIGGDEKFQSQLSETFAVNRKMINHLMGELPTADSNDLDAQIAEIETELILDPSPDPDLVHETLAKYGLSDPHRSFQDLMELSSESVSFLSPQRCKHFFSAIAPGILSEVAQTPQPDETLRTLVRVADSIGAKASLWELLGANRPTMHLMVRLCAAAPYLSNLLIDNPGMIDELIDCLLMNRLPSKDRLDAQSIELCRGAADIDLILHSFKSGAHLMIGVRDILGMDPVEATHASLSDTAEAVVRRVIEHEQEILAEQVGDPIGSEGEPAELLAVALGKFGGREPNYHSDLDVIFLYSEVGETKRRVGGPRSTTTNQLFFNQLAGRVINRINHASRAGRLYELDGRLRPAGEEGLLAVSVDEFLRRFRQDVAPLWQRLALCKARVISGSRRVRKHTTDMIRQTISQTRWHRNILPEIRNMRERMETTATANNIKRGRGGTVDVEVIAQALTLQHAQTSPQILATGTTEALQAIAAAGHLPEVQALQLINNYRTLRRVEANLRLMDTTARHEVPETPDSLADLAFLMQEPDPQMILAQCEQARRNNRMIFDQVFGPSI